jgi:hypothetical protein
MTRKRTSDGRPDELAASCVMAARAAGLALVVRPETPVIPMEGFPFHRYTPVLAERTSWADIEAFVRRLGDIGCGWVNLRFSLAEDGSAVVRYEAKPDGGPLPDGGRPAINGGFDVPRSPALLPQPPHS